MLVFFKVKLYDGVVIIYIMSTWFNWINNNIIWNLTQSRFLISKYSGRHVNNAGINNTIWNQRKAEYIFHQDMNMDGLTNTWTRRNLI